MIQARLKRRLRRAPEDSSTWAALSASLLATGHTDAARSAAESALECARSADDVIAAADLLHRVGRPDLALTGYQRATQVEPDNALAFAALGRFALRFNRLEQACIALTRASTLAPHDHDLRRLLGRALFTHQRVGLATRIFEALWAERPDDVGLAFELAEAASAAGEGDLAIRAIRMAALAAPDRLDIRLRLTACVARHATVEAAVTLLEGLRHDWPQSPEVLLNLASAHANLGDADTALGFIEEARRLRPHQPIIERNRGAILFGAARYEEAAESFEALTHRMPENADAHLLLAIVMHRLHRMGLARKNAERAMALAGEGPVRQQARRLLDALTAPPVVSADRETGPIDDAAVILSGTLERVPVTQILEFARTNDTTGCLLLSARNGVADVRLVDGHLVAASCSNSPNLVDRLVGHGWVTRPVITEWIQRHHTDQNITPLGAPMVATGLITQAQLDQVVEEQIFSVLTAVVQWAKGTFKLIDTASPDEPGNVALRIDGLLLDVMRQLDEGRAAR